VKGLLIRYYVTGNTVIDALLMTAEKNLELGIEIDPSKRLVLITSHRRENFGEPFEISVQRCIPLAERNRMFSSSTGYTQPECKGCGP